MKAAILLISFLVSLSSFATHWVPLIKCHNHYSGESMVFDKDLHGDGCQLVIKNKDLQRLIWDTFHIGENGHGEIIIGCSIGYYGSYWDPFVEGRWGPKRGININHKENSFHMYDYPNNLAVYFNFDYCHYYN